MRARDDRRLAQHHETRAVYTWTYRTDGAYRIDAPLSPDEAVWVHNVLEQKTNELFNAARSACITTN